MISFQRTVNTLAIGCVSCLFVGVPRMVAAEAPAFEHIRFDDLAAELPVRIAWSWNAIGMDPADNVYAVFGGPMGQSHDCVLFRYSPKTGERRLLGTMASAAKAANNWQRGERIEKGHTHLPYLDGRIYIGTMGFHNAQGSVHSERMQFALNSRGAHIMAYDIRAGVIEDLSCNQPNGVFFKGRGMIALETVPEKDLLVGLTLPFGDVLLYGTAQGKTLAVEPGVPGEFGKPVGREVVVAPNGRVYYSYAPGRSSGKPGHMYAYDLTTHKRGETPIEIDASLWNGQTKTRDGKRIYISNQRGDVFQLDYQSDKLIHLGSLYPETDRRDFRDEKYAYECPTVLGITLSRDEKKIYCVPVQRRTPLADLPEDGGKARGPRVLYGLCEFDLESGEARKIREFPPEESMGWLTGSNARDSLGNIYFARHGGGFCGLLKIHVGNIDESDSGQTQGEETRGRQTKERCRSRHKIDPRTR